MPFRINLGKGQKLKTHRYEKLECSNRKEYTELC